MGITLSDVEVDNTVIWMKCSLMLIREKKNTRDNSFIISSYPVSRHETLTSRDGVEGHWGVNSKHHISHAVDHSLNLKPVAVIYETGFSHQTSSFETITCLNSHDSVFPLFKRGAVPSIHQRGESFLHHSPDAVWRAGIHRRCSCSEIRAWVEDARLGQLVADGVWGARWWVGTHTNKSTWIYFLNIVKRDDRKEMFLLLWYRVAEINVDHSSLT